MTPPARQTAVGDPPASPGAKLDEVGRAVRHLRTCVGCRERADRSVLLRVVAAEVDGIWSVVPDPRHRLPGRGAHVHRELACLDLAERRRAFPRALRRSGPLESGAVRDLVAAGG